MQNSKNKLDQSKIEEILFILYRRKYILIFSILLMLMIVVYYNMKTEPVYQASVMLKKEKTGDFEGQFQNLYLTTGEIETEIEIIKTRGVLSRVVNDLQVYFKIENLVDKNGNERDINLYLAEYRKLRKENPAAYRNLPEIVFAEVFPNHRNRLFYLEKVNSKSIGVFDARTGTLLQKSDNPAAAEFNLTTLNMKVNWTDAIPGQKVYLRIDNPAAPIGTMRRNLDISQFRNTNLFTLSIESNSPVMAQMLANTIADKYRENRIQQKRETVRYSYEFVDSLLQDISGKLEKAELKLNSYRKQHQMTMVDEDSRRMIDFLSSLEAEKVHTDIQLAEHRHKLQGMMNQIKSEGYFDQTYLSPNERVGGSGGGAPFAELQKQLADAELRRLELLQKRTENHPDVKALDQQIAEIKRKLAGYNQNTLGAYKIIINTLEEKQAKIESQIQKYSGKVEHLPDYAKLYRQKALYEKIFGMLLDKREQMRIAELSKLQDIVVVEEAHLPGNPVWPNKKLNLIMGFILGLINGIIAITVLEFFNKKVTDIETIENKFDLPILAVFPKYSRDVHRRIETGYNAKSQLVILMEDQPVFRESYRVLRTKLLNYYGEYPQTLLFTSCEENTGKTTVISNFAVSMAQGGKKVLLIDGDLKKPQISANFKIPRDAPGLIQFLTRNSTVPNLYTVYSNKNNNKARLDVITAGGSKENSSELLNSEKIKNLVKMAQENYDFVLFDTPPVSKIVDTLVLGTFIKNTIVVVRPHLTILDTLNHSIKEMTQAKMNLLGFVINACEIQQSSYKYKYGYGYGYYDYQEKTNGASKIKSLFS